MNDKHMQQEDDYGFFYDLEDYDYETAYRKKDNPYNIDPKKNDDDDYENEKKFYQRINRYAIIIGFVINVAIIFTIWK